MLAVAGNDAAVAEIWDLQVLPPHLHNPAPGCLLLHCVHIAYQRCIVDMSFQQLMHNSLQACHHIATFRQPEGMSCGMCMAVQLLPPQAADGGPWVIAGYEDGTLALWDAAAPARPAASAKLHAEAVMALVLDSSGQGVAWYA